MLYTIWSEVLLILAGLVFALLVYGGTDVPRTLELTAGQGRILDFPAEITRVYTSNPEVADVVVIDAHQVIVNAKAAGKATLAVWPQPGPSETIAVTVGFDLAPIRKLLEEAFPDDQLSVSGTRESLVLTGKARK